MATRQTGDPVNDDFDFDMLEESPLDVESLGGNGSEPPDGGRIADTDVPAEFFLLFDLSDEQLQILSEIPRSMVPTMVHMELLRASFDPGVDLLTVWIKTYQKYMISLERKGRIELIEMLKAKIQGRMYDESNEVGLDEEDLWG
tara:strand:- start:970 stop:1401 length:432 start_codon:yes stop_codon:yes gene_type:complete